MELYTLPTAICTIRYLNSRAPMSDMCGPVTKSLNAQAMVDGALLNHNANVSYGAAQSVFYTHGIFFYTGNTCKPLYLPNGESACTGKRHNDYDSTCTFTCNKLHELVGSTETICQADGTWTNPSPFCKGLQQVHAI